MGEKSSLGVDGHHLNLAGGQPCQPRRPYLGWDGVSTGLALVGTRFVSVTLENWAVFDGWRRVRLVVLFSTHPFGCVLPACMACGNR